MPEITPTTTPEGSGIITYKWSSMGDDDTGKEVISAHYSDKDLQVIGTTWDSATLVIEGSNDGGTTYRTLKPVDTNDVTTLSFTTGNPSETILSNPAIIRPKTSGGGGTTDVTVLITMSTIRKG